MISRISKWLEEFLFPAKTDTWIGLFRIGLGLHIIVYSLSLCYDWTYFFSAGAEGLVSRDLSEAILSLDSPLIPRLGWLVTAGNRLGLTEQLSLRFALGGLMISGICLVAGVFSRPAAIVAWFLHLAARSSGGFTSYGVDNFTTTALFYLMICPLPDRYALDRRLWKSGSANPHRIGFHQRVLQVHLCLIYFVAGVAKCLGAGWWNGNSMWRSLTRSPFNILPEQFVLHWSALLPIAGISICLIEAGYPFLIWPRKTRRIWLVLILAIHVGIGLTMGLYLFALILIVMNVAAFGSDLFDRSAASEPALRTRLPQT